MDPGSSDVHELGKVGVVGDAEFESLGSDLETEQGPMVDECHSRVPFPSVAPQPDLARRISGSPSPSGREVGDQAGEFDRGVALHAVAGVGDVFDPGIGSTTQ